MTVCEIPKPFRSLASLVFLASLLSHFAGPLRADQVYNYTGNAFTTFPQGPVCPPACSISGSFDVAQALAPDLSLASITPISFSISSGLTTLTNTDPGDFTLVLSTDAKGAIDGWSWEVVGPAGSPTTRFVTQYMIGDVDGSTFDDLRVGTKPPPFVGPIVAEVFNDPGTWSSAVVLTSTPEPVTALLSAGGLISLIFAKKIRAKH